MTSKQDPVEIDAYMVMLHAAQQGQPLEAYIGRVMNMARKKVKRIAEGLVIE